MPGLRRAPNRSIVIFDADEGVDEEEDVPWSLESWPEPDKKRFGKKKGVAYVTATCRMYWRSDNRLAFRAGVEYEASLADQLMTEAELQEVLNP